MQSDVSLFIAFFSPRENLTLTQKLWLRLFNHPAICNFSYLNEPTDKPRLQETLRQDFHCQFPFFWVVKVLIDFQLETSTSIEG